MILEEIEIPAIWGHIAVRTWGSKENPAILMFHGILDNVGTFNRLIPLLPKHFYYVCVDLPGHGKSSHWPSKSFTNTLDNILVYETVSRYFKQEKYIIIGHSYGGQIAHLYAQLYPEKVEKLILLDTIFFIPIPIYRMRDLLLSWYEQYFDMIPKLENNKPPAYTPEEALRKVMENRRHAVITEESAKPLLERMIVPQDDGKVSFSIDQRIKFYRNPLFDFRAMFDFVKTFPVNCPVLIILGKDSEIQQIIFKRVIKYLKSRKNVRVKVVDGHHDVHNVNPERVAPLITEFLIGKSKL